MDRLPGPEISWAERAGSWPDQLTGPDTGIASCPERSDHATMWARLCDQPMAGLQTSADSHPALQHPGMFS